MAQNIGKIFEQSFRNSVPSYALYYRLPDPPQSFGGGNLRFSSKNPFDCLIWDSEQHMLFAIELKTVAGKSISFERTKEESREIHYHQIVGLNEWNKYDGIIAGFIIEFRQIETTIFLEISEFNKLISLIDKKSFNMNDLNDNHINYLVIEQKKSRTRYTYNIDKFLCDSDT